MFEQATSFILVALIASSSLILNCDAATTVNCMISGGTGITAGTPAKGLAVLGVTAASSGSCEQTGTAVCKRLTITPVGLGSLPQISVSCIDSAATTGASADLTDTAGSALGCGATTTIGTSGGTFSAICASFPCTRTFVPSSTTTGTVASVTAFCSTVADSNKPTPLTCYTGTFSVSATGTANPATANGFCVNTYSATTSSATLTVTATTAASCTATTSVGCCASTNCNTVQMCYVGVYNYATPSSSTFVKTVCALQASGVAYQFCKNTYSYSSGIVITGTCELTCDAVTVTTSSTAASGNTCSSTVFGNSLSSAESTSKISTLLIVAMLSMAVAAFEF
jgi:hypothetical protein